MFLYSILFTSGRKLGSIENNAELILLPIIIVDNAEVFGNSILAKMVGEKVQGFSFKRNDQAVTLASKSAVKVDGEPYQFDPRVLFQRLALDGYGNMRLTMNYVSFYLLWLNQ